ncbi:peroxiredoxin [Streptomyces sp. T12]|nr:peroxiredoxin [Streptomyces sp. T12]
MSRSERSPLLLAGLLAVAGTAHFAAPRQFDHMVPRSLPGAPRAWTYASGAAELALAAGVALPRTRKAAALAAAALFVGVFPANVKMAVDWRHRPAPQRGRRPRPAAVAGAAGDVGARRRQGCGGHGMSGRVEKGDTVEDFAAPDETGTVRRLSELLADGPVVLFFYPAALSPGCTAQACHFRDLASEFAEVGARPVGVSADPVERQAEFAGRHTLGMPLLSDGDGAIRERFGVKRGISVAPTKRATFVIGQDRTVLEVVRSELRMNTHADKALAALRDLRG